MSENLTTKQLADRWQMHPGHIRRMRTEGKGPAWFKPNPIGHRCLYRLADVQSYEEKHMQGRGR